MSEWPYTASSLDVLGHIVLSLDVLGHKMYHCMIKAKKVVELQNGSTLDTKLVGLGRDLVK